MSVKFGFYNSQNGDRKYNAEDFTKIFDGIISDGVFAGYGKRFALSLAWSDSNLHVVVGSGKAWLWHTYTTIEEDHFHMIEKPTPGRVKWVFVRIRVDKGLRSNNIIFNIPPEVHPDDPRPNVPLQWDDTAREYLIGAIKIFDNATYIAFSEVGMGKLPWVVSPVRSIDSTQIYRVWKYEFDEWYNKTKRDFENDFESWKQSTKSNWDNWFFSSKTQYNDFFSGAQTRFESWFANLKDTLSSNAEVRIASRLDNLEKARPLDRNGIFGSTVEIGYDQTGRRKITETNSIEKIDTVIGEDDNGDRLIMETITPNTGSLRYRKTTRIASGPNNTKTITTTAETLQK